MDKPKIPSLNVEPDYYIAFYRKALSVQQQAQRLLTIIDQLETDSGRDGTSTVLTSCPQEVKHLIASLDALALLYHSRWHREENLDHA